MLHRIALSFMGGLLLLLVLVNGSNDSSSFLLGNGYKQKVTLVKKGGSIDALGGDCAQIPEVYKIYCHNATINYHERFYFKIESNKIVPSNPYIENLEHSVYRPCLILCTADYVAATADTTNNVLDIFVLLFEVFIALAACTYIVHLFANRFLWDNNRD
jgi:hypothetical protein